MAPFMLVGIASLVLHCLAQGQVPQPLVIDPSGRWDGLDGPWSTFYVGVGRPLQSFRGVPGINSAITLLPTECDNVTQLSEGLREACGSRTTFRDRDSTSWLNAGIFEIPQNYFDPSNLTLGSRLGLDTFWFGTDTTQFLGLPESYVYCISSPEFFVPVFGLTIGAFGVQQLTKLTILSGLAENGRISSLSFGYTAGSNGSKRLIPVHGIIGVDTTAENKSGSLILGGYDASQVDPKTALSATMPNAINTTMLVNVKAVSISGYTSSSTWTPAPFVIDSVLPQIWMSIEACKMFEEAFRLSWNADLQVYTINDTTHDQLLRESPTVTFTVGAKLEGGSTRNYTLPYSAFDLILSPPLVTRETRYFPLKRSQNGINILGRAFLQEIYIIVDFERMNFTISQAVVAETRDIITIYNSSYTPAPSQDVTPPSPKYLSAGAYAGISIGAALALFLVTILSCAWKKGWWFFRKKSSERDRFDKAELHDNAIPRVEAMEKERAELPANEQSLEVAGSHPHPDIEGIHGLHELHSETRTS
ncbi:aspartic peptidase domain-containing protein [Boeremia exigua]|uniref:aspartic peptidase domain-containing protein n=1 Tax=Boeremia exigua TaxID=749465 RepID=UPI001E8DFEAA|nr:aspartic peptidase domain-containing protein [Boeremia exigua]KAH6644393.1 aspartic peptidase domain-containing protein [Boeremia exigua]